MQHPHLLAEPPEDALASLTPWQQYQLAVHEVRGMNNPLVKALNQRSTLGGQAITGYEKELSGALGGFAPGVADHPGEGYRAVPSRAISRESAGDRAP